MIRICICLDHLLDVGGIKAKKIKCERLFTAIADGCRATKIAVCVTCGVQRSSAFKRHETLVFIDVRWCCPIFLLVVATVRQ